MKIIVGEDGVTARLNPDAWADVSPDLVFLEAAGGATAGEIGVLLGGVMMARPAANLAEPRRMVQMKRRRVCGAHLEGAPEALFRFCRGRQVRQQLPADPPSPRPRGRCGSTTARTSSARPLRRGRASSASSAAAPDTPLFAPR